MTLEKLHNKLHNHNLNLNLLVVFYPYFALTITVCVTRLIVLNIYSKSIMFALTNSSLDHLHIHELSNQSNVTKETQRLKTFSTNKI